MRPSMEAHMCASTGWRMRHPAKHLEPDLGDTRRRCANESGWDSGVAFRLCHFDGILQACVQPLIRQDAW